MRSTVIAVATGGALGALARYGLARAWPPTPGGFPWATLWINVSGCLLIGILMAWLSAKAAPRWVRPLLGIGALGGFTTFSTYIMDSLRLVDSGHPYLGLVYALLTPVAALTAVFIGSQLSRKVFKA